MTCAYGLHVLPKKMEIAFLIFLEIGIVILLRILWKTASSYYRNCQNDTKGFSSVLRRMNQRATKLFILLFGVASTFTILVWMITGIPKE